jgi:hypothetical protein
MRKIYQGRYELFASELEKDPVTFELIREQKLQPCLNCQRWVFREELAITQKIEEMFNPLTGKVEKIDNPIIINGKCIYCIDEPDDKYPDKLTIGITVQPRINTIDEDDIQFEMK